MESNINKPLKELLVAKDSSGLGRSYSFKIFEDSTYVFTVKTSQPDYDNVENYKGSVQIKNDSLTFSPFEFKFNTAQKAILKNNSVIFLGGEYPFRIAISQTNLVVKNYFNSGQFPDYSTFNIYEIEYNFDDQKPFTDYDLNDNDLKSIKNITEKLFSENTDKLNPKADYVKQCYGLKNAKGEIKVFVNAYCKDSHILSNFKTQIIRMHDGGNCNIHFEIDLKNKTYKNLQISGMA